MSPKGLATNSQDIRIEPGWFWWALIGIAVNLAGGVVWLGAGRALFIAGALTVAVSLSWISLFSWLAARVLAARTVKQPRR